MKRIFFLPFLLFLCTPSSAQRKAGDTVMRYLNASLQLTTAGEAVFYGVSFKQGDQWYLHAVYPDTGTLMQAHFRDHKLEVAHGPFVLYHPKRVPAQVGQYSNGRMEGLWTLYYPDGQLKDSGAYVQGMATGTWTGYHPNGQRRYKFSRIQERVDKDRKVFLNATFDGPYNIWYPDGQPEVEGVYANGNAEGHWTWYFANGNKASEEWYKQGRLTAQQCYDSLSGKLTGESCPVIKGAQLKDYGDYKVYVMERLTWPEEALKLELEGSATVWFRVDTEGRLHDLRVTGTHPVFTEAVRKFFEALPPWEPAVLHNRVREWTDDWVIPFRH